MHLSEQPTLTKKSILLVDDDRLIHSTLSVGLVRAGYEVSTAASVDNAETWLDNNKRPDLVILDVHMPNRSGLELTKRLGELENIPFILFTAYTEQEIVTQANASGAMGYLVKPIQLKQLIPAIETALSRAADQQSLSESKQQLQAALDSNRDLSIAIGIVMNQLGIGRDSAMKQLRKKARNQNIKLNTLASMVIHARETLSFEE